MSRTGTLRGAGNAIVPQVAAEFIAAFMDIDRERSGNPSEEHHDDDRAGGS